MEVLVATRTYKIDDVTTGREHMARDYMYRKPCGSFVLKETSDMPGERGDEVSYSLEGVFAWLREMPWQVSRSRFHSGINLLPP